MRHHLEEFTRHAEADELMVVPAPRTVEGRLRTLELLAGSLLAGAH